MIVPARKVDTFLEKHAHRVSDPLVRPDREELPGLIREARMLAYGATPNETAHLFLFISVCEGLLGDHDAALESLQRAKAASPSNANIAVDLGATLGHLDRIEEALDCFREAERLAVDDDANRAVAMRNQARALGQLGQMDAAEAVLRRLLEGAAPSEYGPLVQFAEASASLSRPGDAVEFLARALCARANRPRGEAPALDVIDLFAPTMDMLPGASPDLRLALLTVREWESAEVSPEMAVSAQIVLPPDAWNAFARILSA